MKATMKRVPASLLFASSALANKNGNSDRSYQKQTFNVVLAFLKASCFVLLILAEHA